MWITLFYKSQSERRAKFQKFAELYYKFSPMFVKHIPGKTVDAWKAAERHLNPKKLIPALIQCNQPGDKNQATPEEQVGVVYTIYYTLIM